MSLIRQALGIEERSAPPGYGVAGAGKWNTGMVWTPWGSSGSSWTTEQAMRLSAVFGCLRLLSEAICTLPADTFIRSGGVRTPYRPRPEFLSFQPPQQSKIQYLSQVMLSLLTDGNAFVATPRDEMGVPTDLCVLDPTMVEVRSDRGQVTFQVLGYELTPADIMHIPGMMMPGALRGVSPLKSARDAIDIGARAQEFGRNALGNMGVPPAVIEVPPSASGTGDREAEKAKARTIGELWNETHGGTQNAGKVGVLMGGAKLTSVALSPEDMEWLDTRRFGIGDIARFYGVPNHLLNDATGSTSWGSGLSEQNTALGALVLRPWTERIEEGHSRLLSTIGMPDVFWKLNLDALLRADMQERYLGYATGIAWHFLTPNEARVQEDLAPLPGGDAWPDPVIATPTAKVPR